MTDFMPPAITADQMREVDRLMIEEYGISLEQMMENAGRNLADLAMEMLYQQTPIQQNYTVTVACGTGNNGGGGMVAARFLANRGVNVTGVLAGLESTLKPVPAKRWKTLNRLNVTTIAANNSDNTGAFCNADLVIDAILGYGLRGEPRGIPALVIRQILDSQNPNVLSLDIPSGLDSSRGPTGKTCIKSKATLTLAFPKTGLFAPKAREYVGQLYLADIGVPPELYTHLGLPPQHLFTVETVVRLNSTI